MMTSWEQAIRQLVQDLVDGMYDAIAADGRVGRLSASELRGAVEGYGHTLVALPDHAFAFADVVPSRHEPGIVAVEVPLWTLEEGRSDLTLSVSIRESDERVAISIEDLHVL